MDEWLAGIGPRSERAVRAAIEAEIGVPPTGGGTHTARVGSTGRDQRTERQRIAVLDAAQLIEMLLKGETKPTVLAHLTKLGRDVRRAV